MTEAAGRAGRGPGTRTRVGAVVAIAIAAGLLAWLLIDRNGTDDQSAATTTTATQPGSNGHVVTPAALRAVASAAGQPFYWAGPQAKTTYELTRLRNGRTFVRYLSKPSEVGNQSVRALTVATYPMAKGYSDLTVAGHRPNAVIVHIANNGIAVYDRDRPENVYLSYPGARYQVEVYSPVSGQPLQLVASGQVQPVTAAARSAGTTTSAAGTAATAAAAHSVSAAELRAQVAAVTHPIFWAGPRKSSTYELTVTTDGRTFVRYLPAGVKPGDKGRYLTIATYPDALGYQHVLKARSREGATVIAPGDEIAATQPGSTSVFLSQPGAKYQVEIYSPEAGQAKQLVTSGQITPAG